MRTISIWWPSLAFLAIYFGGIWFAWRDLDGRKPEPEPIEPQPLTRRVRCISGELKPSFDSRNQKDGT
jgi:hypothetical protein